MSYKCLRAEKQKRQSGKVPEVCIIPELPYLDTAQSSFGEDIFNIALMRQAARCFRLCCQPLRADSRCKG